MAKSKIKNLNESLSAARFAEQDIDSTLKWATRAGIKGKTLVKLRALKKVLQGAVRHRERLVGR